MIMTVTNLSNCRITAAVVKFPNSILCLQVNNVKQYVNVSNERNGLFYTSNIYLLLDIKLSSQQYIVVICTVGHTSFTVVNNTLPYFLGNVAISKKVNDTLGTN